MEYSTQTQIYLEKYNVTFKDLVFCSLIASGMSLSDAYQATFNNKFKSKTNNAKIEAEAKELIRVNPSFSLLINEIKRKKNKITNNQTTAADLQGEEVTEEERQRYETREGLIEEMIKSLRTTSGKDSLNVLQSLAKLQGLDKPNDNEGEERRRFVLRFLSHCRTCKLMKAYLEIQNELKE